MKNMFVYRKANIEDALCLSVLYKQVYIQTYGTEGVSKEFASFITKQFSEERISNAIISNPDSVIVAEYKSNLIGVSEIEFNKKCPVDGVTAPELNKLYILEWFCGKGVGENLLKESEKIIIAKGIDEIWLWVLSSNERAVSFYEKHDYKWIGNAFFQMEVNNYENKVMFKKLNV